MADLIGPVLLLLLGLGLLIAEVFLPSAGVIGLLAFAFFGASVYLAYSASPTMGFRWLVFEGVIIPVIWIATVNGLARTRFGRRIFLQPPVLEERNGAHHLHPARPTIHPVGSAGRAVTPLRPSGMIDVAGSRVEALAESGLIDAGAAVIVVAIRSGRVVVRET